MEYYNGKLRDRNEYSGGKAKRGVVVEATLLGMLVPDGRLGDWPHRNGAEERDRRTD